LILDKGAWLRAADRGYVQVWLEGFEGQEKIIVRAMAFSGYPFGSTKNIKCSI
jgi:hypothetical protein